MPRFSGFLILLVFAWGYAGAQNLAPNPDFETFTSCPINVQVPGLPDMECGPWYSGNFATPDYFNACNTGSVGIPENVFGWQPALSGTGYAGIWSRAPDGSDYREYLQAPLLQPLVAGTWYNVHFYVSLVNAHCGIQELGAYFSVVPPPYNGTLVLNVVPQVESEGNYYRDTVEWMLVEGCFRAAGGESFITIGNFHINQQTPLDPSCTGDPFGYYYVDDVYVAEMTPAELVVNLQDTVKACDTYTIDPAVIGVTYTWEDGSHAPQLTVTSSGTYSVTIFDGCRYASDSITVEIENEAQLPFSLGMDTVLCTGSQITLDFDPGLGDFLWQDNSTASSYTISGAGTYILTVTTLCGSSGDTLVVTEEADDLQVDLGPDVTACDGEVVTIVAGVDDVTYVWQDGSVLDTYTATATGWVHVTVTDRCGSDMDSLYVDMSQSVPAPMLGADTILCVGSSLLLMSAADAFTSIEWQDGSQEQIYLVTNTGSYSLTETNQCGSGTDEISVSFLSAPVPFSLGADTALCPGASFLLHAPLTADNILWQDGSDQSAMLVDQAQSYSLLVYNVCGVEVDSLIVDIDTDIPIINLPSILEWCPGDQFTLDAGQSFDATYVWNTGQDQPSIDVSAPGIYTVEVIAPCSTSSSSIEVLVSSDCTIANGIYIPNVFSPNDDQVNDLFSVSFGSGIQVTGIEGVIYDRWGNMVYSYSGIPFEWDGWFGGERVMPGVYVYHLKIKYLDGSLELEERFVGDVTVVR
jgi:gliding motility-associated-like protein